MSAYTIVLLLTCFSVLEILYFRIAKRFNIVDKPNHRSSHTKITVRGGGIIFPVALIIGAFLPGFNYPFFLIGLAAISLISFIDDAITLKSGIRLIIHLIAALLLVWQLTTFTIPVADIFFMTFFVIACVNAVNFMDGINGITGLYTLTILGTLYYLNTTIGFTNNAYLLVGILALLVFNFFNFRKKAVCFAGDVGSVSIAFAVSFFLLALVTYTHNINYLLFLSIYIADTATTIFFRILRKENISTAHKSHFYQFLANEKGIGHLYVAALYAVTQVLINIAVIKNPMFTNTCFFIILAVFIITFTLLRFGVEGKARLINRGT